MVNWPRALGSRASKVANAVTDFIVRALTGVRDH